LQESSENLKILVVDDQLRKFQLLKRIVSKIFADAEFIHCSTSNAARSILKNYSIDFIFIDMSFNINSNPSEEAAWEGLAGLRVLQSIYRLRVQAKAIVFTAHSGDYKDPHNSEILTFSDLEKHVKKYFPQLCIGCVYSKQSDEKLLSILRGLML